MMRAEYKRENHKSYFVIQDSRLDENKEGISHDLSMLCENSIEGLLPISVHSFNGQTELYYDISGKQPLQILYEKIKLRKEDLYILFQGLEQAVSELEDYFLDTECLIIDPEYMYVNVGKQKLYLLYYPFSEEDFEESVMRFSDYILDKICNEDEQTVVYAYNFYRLVKEEKGNLASALRLLQQEDGPMPEKSPEPQEYIKEEPFYLDDENQNLADFSADANEERIEKKSRGKLRVAIFGSLALFGVGIMAFSAWQYGLDFSDLFTKTESIVGLAVTLIASVGFGILTAAEYLLQNKMQSRTEPEGNEDGCTPITDESAFLASLCEDFSYEPELENKECGEIGEREAGNQFETVLLQENCYSEQRILKGKIRGKTKQIDLAVFPFMIGKSKEQVDFVIEDSSISRIHARFTLRDDIVFLTDLNSTNGTMKNGVRLQPNELVSLESGDEIRFGKVVFTYY